MTPSVALGVTIDDVVHFLLWFRRGIEKGLDRRNAVLLAYQGCARAMYQSWGVIGLGLSMFALSSFTPTMRFGALMVALLTAGLVGNLLFLPALLTRSAGRRHCVFDPSPHGATAGTGSHRQQSHPRAAADRRSSSPDRASQRENVADRGSPLNILFSEGSSTSARQSISALGHWGYTIDVCDPQRLCLGRFSRYVRAWQRCPSFARAAGTSTSAFLSIGCSNERYDVLLPTHDQVFLLSRYRDDLGRLTGLAVPDFESVRAVQSKIRFAELLRQLKSAAAGRAAWSTRWMSCTNSASIHAM